MSRLYTIQCHHVSASAVQDVLSALAGASRTIRLLAVQLGQDGQTTIGNYALSVKRFAAGFAAGSGGTTPTPVPMDPNDAAASFTAHANDTTQATGTNVTIFADEFSPINGYYWQAPDPSQAPQASPNQALVLSLDGISGTIFLSATLWVEEL